MASIAAVNQDEILVECPEADAVVTAEWLAPNMTTAMQELVEDVVPIPVGVTHGPSLGRLARNRTWHDNDATGLYCALGGSGGELRQCPGKVGITVFCVSEEVGQTTIREAKAGNGAAGWTATPAMRAPPDLHRMGRRGSAIRL